MRTQNNQLRQEKRGLPFANTVPTRLRRTTVLKAPDGHYHPLIFSSCNRGSV